MHTTPYGRAMDDQKKLVNLRSELVCFVFLFGLSSITSIKMRKKHSEK